MFLNQREEPPLRSWQAGERPRSGELGELCELEVEQILQQLWRVPLNTPDIRASRGMLTLRFCLPNLVPGDGLLQALRPRGMSCRTWVEWMLRRGLLGVNEYESPDQDLGSNERT